VASGGPHDPDNNPCIVLAGINGINALLAGTDACAQQNNTDAMVDISQLHGIRLWSRTLSHIESTHTTR
jgi:hypothetical protein